MMQEMKGCCFADVSYPVELILRDRFGVLSANSFEVFQVFGHADNHLYFSLGTR